MEERALFVGAVGEKGAFLSRIAFLRLVLSLDLALALGRLRFGCRGLDSRLLFSRDMILSDGDLERVVGALHEPKKRKRPEISSYSSDDRGFWRKLNQLGRLQINRRGSVKFLMNDDSFEAEPQSSNTEIQ